MGARWSIPLAYGCLVGSTGVLALGFLDAGIWQMSSMMLVLGLLGLVGGWYRWRWWPSFYLALYCGSATTAFWLDVWPGWPLLGLLGAIAASDLFHFSWRLESAMVITGDPQNLEKRHLRRLAVVLGIGALLYLVAWLSQIQLSFGLALLLGLISVLGISLGLDIRRRSQE